MVLELTLFFKLSYSVNSVDEIFYNKNIDERVIHHELYTLKNELNICKIGLNWMKCLKTEIYVKTIFLLNFEILIWMCIRR